MKQELVRINSIDGLELPGILYTPDIETKKIVIHVHGLSGNFYENRFLDYIARSYTNNGYAFITFNNRGKDYITELLKENKTVIIGSSYELFEDSTLDIGGIVNWVKEKGFNEISLEGHSYGCNKVVYYYDIRKDKSIKNIILLAPCDIAKEFEIYLGDLYNSTIEKAKKLVKSNKGQELIDFSVFANGKISAKTFYTDYLYNSKSDIFRYREKNSKSEILSKIDIPVYIIFGDEDEDVLTQDKDVIINYLNKNINNCKIELLQGANHMYDGKYEELATIVGKYKL